MRPIHNASIIILILLLTAVCLTGAAGAAEWVVTKQTDSPAGQAISDEKSVTLRQAVEKSSADDTIVFNVSEISLTKGELVIKKNLTFDARGRIVTIQRNTDSVTPEARLMNISGASVEFRGITFKNGYISNESAGVALVMNASVSFEDCTFQSNRAVDAGAVYSRNNSTLRLNNCVFSDNTVIADKAENAFAGAVRIDRSTLDASDCRFSGNTAAEGGAVYLQSGSATMTNCTFAGNHAANGTAGSVSVAKDAAAVFNRCTFADGTARNGGAVFLNGTASFNNCYFENNSATVGTGTPAGGAVLVNGTGKLNVSSSVFANNSAKLSVAGGYGNGSGGAISVEGANASAAINDSTFLTNNARYGGALHATGTMNVTNCSLYGNTAKETGGGIACYVNSSVTVKKSAIVNNTAEGRGGAYDGGGGIYVKLGSLAIYGNVIDENTDRKNTDVFCENGSVLSTGKNAIGTARGFTFPQTEDDLANLSVVLKNLVRMDGSNILIPANEQAGSSQRPGTVEKIIILSAEPTTQAPAPTTEAPTTDVPQPTTADDDKKGIPAIGIPGIIGGLALACLAAKRRKKA